MNDLIFEKLPSQLKREIIHKTGRNNPTLNDIFETYRKQSEHYYCQDFLWKRLNNSLIEEIINTRTHIKIKIQRNHHYKILQLIFRSRISSHKLNSCKNILTLKKGKKMM